MAEPRPQQSRDLVVRAPENPSSTGPLYTNSWAIVVGIDSYRDSRIPKLRYAERDAEAIASQLPSVGFPPENITLLLASRNPEKLESSPFLNLLQSDLHDRMNLEDQLLFYFAGHGVTSLLGDERRGYLLLPGSKVGGQWPSSQHPDLDDVPAGALDTIQLRELIKGLRPKHKLVILDACFGGLIVQPRAFYGAVEVSENSVARWTKKRVTQILTAGGAGEQALENDSYQHGLFTYFLLRGLDDAVRPGQKIVPAVELSSYVKQKVSAEGPQNPQTQNYGEGEFLFIRQPIRSKESQVHDFCALAAAALEAGDWNEAESAVRAAQAVAGDAAELEAPIAPVLAKMEAARTAARVTELIAQAGEALAGGQLKIASDKLAEAQKLSQDPDHAAAIARIKSGIAAATAEITCAAYLRDGETALASGNWKTAQARLSAARGVCPPDSSKLNTDIAAFENKLQGFAHGRAQKLVGEAGDAVKIRKFAAAQVKLDEARALPVGDAALVKAIADAQTGLAAARKVSGDRVAQIVGVVLVVGFWLAVGAAAIWLLGKALPYLALGFHADFWGRAFTSAKTWFGSLQWYGWLGLVVAGIIVVAVFQKNRLPVALYLIWMLWQVWSTMQRDATKAHTSPMFLPRTTNPLRIQPGSAAQRFLDEQMLQPTTVSPPSQLKSTLPGSYITVPTNRLVLPRARLKSTAWWDTINSLDSTPQKSTKQ